MSLNYAARQAIVLLAFVSLAPSLWAGPTNSADFWLDRARESIAAVHKAPPAKDLPGEVDLAVMLAADRLNEPEKVLLKQVLETVDERNASLVKEAYRPFLTALARTQLLWAMRDRDGARGELKRAIELSRNSNGPTILGMDVWKSVLASQAAELGDYDTAVGLSDELGSLSLLGHFIGGGHRELADRLVRETLQEIRARKPDPDGNAEMALLNLVREQAAVGDVLNAAETAKSMPLSWPRQEAFRATAKAAYQNGDHKIAHDLLDAALTDARSLPQESRNCLAVAEMGVLIGEKDIALLAAKTADAAMPQMHSDQLQIAPRLARIYLNAGGDREAFKRLVALAEAAGPGPGDTLASRERLMDIAACYAMDGRDGEVDWTLAAMAKQDFSLTENFGRIIVAYASSGQFDRATALVEKYLGIDDRAMYYEVVACEAVHTGRFELALSIAGKIRVTLLLHQVRPWRLIARQQAKAGKTDDIAAWVDKIDNPAARAAIDLGVAEQLLGVRHRFASAMFQDE
ncbi:MAG: hypothetical protein ACHRHE_22110 [Tepidisphaerales bacterium]